MPVATYTKAGAKATTAAQLDKSVFGVEVKSHDLLKQAYVATLANKRANLAVTKTRGDVSGGGKKPWKQKGTGRARVGSSRNPIWRSGGIVFGPTGNENYTKSVNKKAKRLAVRQALSLAAGSDKLIVIESIDFKAGKVAPIVKLLAKINASGRVLLVLPAKDELVERSIRNIEGVKAVLANYLTVNDLLDADSVVMTNDSLKTVSEWLGETK